MSETNEQPNARPPFTTPPYCDNPKITVMPDGDVWFVFRPVPSTTRIVVVEFRRSADEPRFAAWQERGREVTPWYMTKFEIESFINEAKTRRKAS